MNAEDAARVAWRITDMEGQRCAALRLMLADADMLERGLHALRNGSPDVAAEYMERALERCRASADALR